ncbi:MAG: hypothetical protein BRC28_03950 [Nanohaloarchaea archaeon SW_4_43_9]|nr:MAG: hypothetical protein BRC28_03950 [Nanohaloarchaea archaeon SW_4_43_9]
MRTKIVTCSTRRRRGKTWNGSQSNSIYLLSFRRRRVKKKKSWKSTYQRDRVEKIAEELGLKVFAPLWQHYQENYMKWLVREGFRVEITDVAARGLEKSWEGKILDQESVDKLIELSREYGFNPAGEGGEYETKVVGFPNSMFSDK